MKILQVTNFFKPSFESGGVARVAYNISKHLVDNGHDVTVFTTNRSLKNIKVETNKALDVEGMNVYYFENLRKYFPVKIPPFAYYLPFVANKIIQNFDIIHIHEHRTLLAIIIHHYATKHNIPYVVQPHGSVLPFFQSVAFKRFFDLFFGNRILNDASALIALTKTESEQIKKMAHCDNITIIPNGIDISEYRDLPKKGKFRRKYSIKDDEKIILFLGRINKIKGIDLLIEAFSNLNHEVNNIKLVIAGPDDGSLNNLKEQVCDLDLEHEVLFTGPLYGRNKLEAYIDADIYVLPSRYETFPNTVLEASACGTPVIITDRCGITDVVEGKLGLVVEFDKEKIKNAISKSLNDSNSIKKDMGDVQLVKEYFNWSNVIKQIEDLYSICSKSSNKGVTK